MNIRYFGILILLLLPSMASAKLDATTRSRMMQDAAQAFQTGNYEEARKSYYNIYVEDGDKTSKELLDKCKKCIEIMSDAIMDERNGLYSHAIEKYNHILELNPLDPQIQHLIGHSKAKLYEPLLQDSRDLYREGKYIEAQSKLSEYLSQTGVTDVELSTAINQCIELNNKAIQATQQKEYAEVINHYKSILEINPTDVISTNAIAKLESQSKRTVSASASSTIVVKTKVNRGSYCQ